ncbi:Protein of unknown function [Pseudomonas sp. Z003-0.4C(8344-21)]|uniref:DUF3833 domain-containing protein n=1 Tax=Pseudomonas sp. Z003-0.4C(8344-21) TaxID=1855380 RepID=UPI00087C82CF|nr:DUF3833 domain-containing protein [Pseudomonas sp. Z003-0.4C(8344-21)]SDT06339.1 Protein of unknown function [Pseudomonas sp. Z003-0.4C(8344-21)]
MLKACTLLLCLALASCSSVDVRSYSQEKPMLELREFFEGRVEAWGIFQKRSGEVAKRFHVVINGHSEGSKLILDEAFTYSDGTKQKRVWTLTPDGPGQWRGTAGDVVGEARGEIAGNTLRWRYVLRLPVDGEEYDVELDDWMYLMDSKTLINRSYMSKFGVEVGQITLFFRK